MRKKDEAKREKIIDAVVKLISTRGLHDASMSKIAKEASLSPATIYLYFKNKEVMVNKVYLEKKKQLATAIFTGLEEGQETRSALSLIWRNCFDYVSKYSQDLKFLEQFWNSPMLCPETEEQAKSFFLPLSELVEQGIKNKALKELPPEIFMSCFFQPLIHLTKLHVSQKFELDNSLLELAFMAVWDAVRRG
ncbi:MAG: AcrR family transcriptional regulator [bacterium]|jgi:AcrR family transcriptional regulator